MLVRAVLIVWEAVLISVFVIEEYRNKTIGLLFTYPISRTKLIIAKLFLICGIMFLFHVLSNIFQYISIFLAKKCFDFVRFSFGNILVQTVTTISFVLLGFFPLYVGIIKKSTIATVVSSIVIVVIASNSQGNNTGLISMPVVAIIFGMIGVIFSVVPVPSVEIMKTIRVISLVVGICFVDVRLFFLFLNKKKGKEKKTTALWIVMGVGVLLIMNYGIQLLF